MAKFGPVAPVRILDKLAPHNFGDYHLLLAHDVAANANEFRKTFAKVHMPTIIMDNSVIELGNAVDLGTIKKAVLAVDSTSIVLPDVLLDAKATYESCSAALETWPAVFGDLGYINGARRGFMIVPQGKTLEEWAWCAQQFDTHPLINFWGIPRNLVGQIGSRRDALEIAYALNPHRRIHLLGFSDNLCDDIIVAKDRRVEGIDSAVPLRLGSLGINIGFNFDIPPRGNWWDTATHNILMDDNISEYKRWIARK